MLNCLAYCATLPVEAQLSPAIPLAHARQAREVDALLACLAAAPSVERLALLNAASYAFERAQHLPVTRARPTELHLFQSWVFEGLLGTAKFFKHLDAPLRNPLRPPPRANKACCHRRYPPSQRALASFCAISELLLKASRFILGKPARNKLIFHGCCAHDTRFSIRRCHSLIAFCSPASGSNLALASSLRVDVAHLTQPTFSSAYPYDWSRFFRHPDA
jgi:hypothetical protein